MTKLPIGWCIEAGRLAGEAERGNYAVTQPSARRPQGWRPGGSHAPTRTNRTRGAEKAKHSKRADRKLAAMGTDAEGEE